MSYDEQDVAYDRFVEGLRKEFSESILDEIELYDKVVEDFKASRLRTFYENNPLVAQPANGALGEARILLANHPSAALVFALIAAEVCIKKVLLFPVLHGAFHTESAADLIVERVIAVKDEKLIGALIRVLASHTGSDLHVFSRTGCTKPLWEEMNELQKLRNGIIHRASTVSVTDAQRAIAVAESLLNQVFPDVISKLGLHLHEDLKIYDSPKRGGS